MSAMTELDPETMHADLTAAGLPSTLAEMKNPTEEYVFNLVTQFLNTFHIDLAAIRRPTFEQLNLGIAEENPEILMLVNISEVMANISKFIFLKAFYLTDITTPVPKRTRRIARFLLNFVVYAGQKMDIIEEQLEKNTCKIHELNNLREETNKLIEARNAKAVENSKKLALKEQLLREIEQVRARKEERRPKIAERAAKLSALEQEKLELVQQHGKLKNEFKKMRKATDELESKVVKSPRRYEASLQEMMEQKKIQMEKRAIMQEKIGDKKPAIEKIESYLSIVRQEHTKFSDVMKSYISLLENKTVIEDQQKKITEMRSIIEQEAMMYAAENEQSSNTVMEKAKEECEKSLSSIRKEQTELLNEKKVLEKALEDAMTRQQEVLSHIDKIRASTKDRDDEHKAFVKNCQELYDAEIKQEREMRSMFDKNMSNDRRDAN